MTMASVVSHLKTSVALGFRTKMRVVFIDGSTACTHISATALDHLLHFAVAVFLKKKSFFHEDVKNQKGITSAYQKKHTFLFNHTQIFHASAIQTSVHFSSSSAVATHMKPARLLHALHPCTASLPLYLEASSDDVARVRITSDSRRAFSAKL